MKLEWSCRGNIRGKVDGIGGLCVFVIVLFFYIIINDVVVDYIWF